MLQGYFEGGVVQLTQRHQQRRKRRKTADERAVRTELPLPPPGDTCFLLCSGMLGTSWRLHAALSRVQQWPCS